MGLPDGMTFAFHEDGRPGLRMVQKQGDYWEKEREIMEMKIKQRTEKMYGEPSLANIGKGLRDGRYKNVIIMTGAGLSTAAGIPDFRSADGLYAMLKEKYGMSEPSQLFSIDFFRKNPEPFFERVRELDFYPGGKYKPTVAHLLAPLLHKKGILTRNFTQNIDGLDTLTSLPLDKLVEAHGGFTEAQCIVCRKDVDPKMVKEKTYAGEIPLCPYCGGTCKPKIVFFGEGLPKRFWSCAKEDFPKCDLLIVMGTSLVVNPFAGLAREPGFECVRMLFNLELAGEFEMWDVFQKGTCDGAVEQLCEHAGWGDELKAMMVEFDVPKSRGPNLQPNAWSPSVNEEEKKDEDNG